MDDLLGIPVAARHLVLRHGVNEPQGDGQAAFAEADPPGDGPHERAHDGRHT